MNLILFSKQDMTSANVIHLTGRRFEHIKTILKAKAGDVLSVGRVSGLTGLGKIIDFGKDSIDLEVKLNQKPPVDLDVIVVMALPRPPMLKRSLQCLASLGIKKIIILNCHRVEKSLWQSSALKKESIHEDLILGLEQSKDTILPEVILESKFKPFVQDQLPKLIKNRKSFVAHPGSKKILPKVGKSPSLLVIGPEGGFVDFEIDLLKAVNLIPVHLGPRILRFENALCYALGKMS